MRSIGSVLVLLLSCALLCPGVSQASVEANIGFVGSHLTYREQGVRQRGYLGGIGGAVAVHQGWMARLEGYYLTSDQINYSSSDSGTMSNMSDDIYEIRGLFGQDYYTDNMMRITPYTGLGYRHLENDSAYRTTSTGATGYDREQAYTYWPIGILTQGAMGDGSWLLGARFEYDKLLRGNNLTKLGTIPGYHNLSFHQTQGSAVLASFTIEKRLSDRDMIKGIALTPYIKYWDIKASNVNEGYYEPNNSTTEMGASLSFTF